MNTTAKWTAAIISMAFLFSLVACGSKYADAQDIMEKQADAMEAYCEGLEQARNADDIVTAVNAFSADMAKLAEKMQSFKSKYPELYQNSGEMPPELEATNKRLTEITQRMAAASMKMAPYMMNSKVQQAMMQMSAAMAQMGGK